MNLYTSIILSSAITYLSLSIMMQFDVNRGKKVRKLASIAIIISLILSLVLLYMTKLNIINILYIVLLLSINLTVLNIPSQAMIIADISISAIMMVAIISVLLYHIPYVQRLITS